MPRQARDAHTHNKTLKKEMKREGGLVTIRTGVAEGAVAFKLPRGNEVPWVRHVGAHARSAVLAA